MSFPTSDMVDAFSNYLDAHGIANEVLKRRPELADVLHEDPGRPIIRLDLPGGGAVVCARVTESGVTAWTVGTPDKPLDPDFGTGKHPGDSMAGWMLDEYDRLASASAACTSDSASLGEIARNP
ncbi:hypothetical protein IEE94_08970 [Yimella sp. cx-573]|nr:hypothetical protein [Yimella sp. cx-573]